MPKKSVIMLLIIAILGLGILWGNHLATQQEKDDNWQEQDWDSSEEEKEEIEELDDKVNPEPTSYSEALALAKEVKKDLFVLFVSKPGDCPYCDTLQETLSDKKVQRALSRYVTYTVKVHDEPSVTKQFEVTGVPAYFLVNSKRSTEDSPKIIKSGKGHKDPRRFLLWLDVRPPTKHWWQD
jgi:thioredoxin-related protein